MLRRFSALCLLMFCIWFTAHGQRHAPWRFGAVGGAALNVAGVGYALWGPNGGTNPQRDAGQFIADVALDGEGLAPYGGLFAEYASTSWWGLHTRVAYDDRSLTALDELSYVIDGKAVTDAFRIRTSYLSFDPRLRITPVRTGGLFFTLGAGLHVPIRSVVDYTADGMTAATFDLPQKSNVAWSLTFGAGYDIFLTESLADVQWRLAPFIDASWMFNQRGSDPPPLTAATSTALTTFTARAGFMVSRGAASDAYAPDIDDDGFFITVTAPRYPAGTMVRTVDDMPMVASVFIAPTDTALPSRYRVRRLREQDTTFGYYDVVSVAAKLLSDDPSLTITLIGSDPLGEQGDALANIVRAALVSIATIDASRIRVTAQRNPNVVSGSALTPAPDRAKADEENRRVDLVLSDPLRWPRIRLHKERQAMIENSLLVTVVTDDALEPWSVNVAAEHDKHGRAFGPFNGNQTVIPDATLGRGKAPRLTVEAVARSREGVSRSDKRWVTFPQGEPQRISAHRHVLLHNYGEDDPVRRHAAAVATDVAPRVPSGARVIIHGHTDDIGSDVVNRGLSYQYASGIASVLRHALDARGTRSVEIIAVGHGEDATDAVFNNRSPEGRFYNRAIIFDIVFP